MRELCYIYDGLRRLVSNSIIVKDACKECRKYSVLLDRCVWLIR